MTRCERGRRAIVRPIKRKKSSRAVRGNGVTYVAGHSLCPQCWMAEYARFGARWYMRRKVVL